MTFGALRWGFVGASPLVVALACSGQKLNDVGDMNTSGNSGSGASSHDDDQGGADAGGEPSYGGAAGAGEAGAGGAAGHDGEAGAGGAIDVPDPVCVGCSIVAEEQGDVRDIEVDDDNVYWIDHGSFDRFHNHNEDGRIVARGLTGGPITVLADTLSGPHDLEISATYAYALVDAMNSAKRIALVRVPLTGGPVEVLSSGDPLLGWFGTVGTTSSFTYWTQPLDVGTAVYRIAETPGSSPELIGEGAGAKGALADAANVYLFDNDAIHVMPAAGGEPTLFQVPQDGGFDPLAIDPEYVYALEYWQGPCCDNTRYIVRMSKTAGDRKRIAKIDNGYFAMRGELFFANLPIQGGPQMYDVADRLLQGDFAAPDELRPIVIGPVGTATVMAPSSVGLFFGGGSTVRLAPYLE